MWIVKLDDTCREYENHIKEDHGPRLIFVCAEKRSHISLSNSQTGATQMHSKVLQFMSFMIINWIVMSSLIEYAGTWLPELTRTHTINRLLSWQQIRYTVIGFSKRVLVIKIIFKPTFRNTIIIAFYVLINLFSWIERLLCLTKIFVGENFCGLALTCKNFQPYLLRRLCCGSERLPPAIV